MDLNNKSFAKISQALADARAKMRSKLGDSAGEQLIGMLFDEYCTKFYDGVVGETNFKSLEERLHLSFTMSKNETYCLIKDKLPAIHATGEIPDESEDKQLRLELNTNQGETQLPNFGDVKNASQENDGSQTEAGDTSENKGVSDSTAQEIKNPITDERIAEIVEKCNQGIEEFEAVKLMKEMKEGGLSIRKISELLSYSKSKVERALKV